MRATFSLLNSYFWKTIYGPVLAFIFPPIILGIMGSIFKIEYVFPGIIALNIMLISVLALPLAIMELRSSSLFKYIGSSPVNTKKFSFVVIAFYVIVMLVSTIILYLFTLGFFHEKTLAGSHQGFQVIRAPGKYLVGSGSTGWTGNAEFIAKPVTYSKSIFSNLLLPKGILEFMFAILVHIVFSILVGLTISTFSKTPQQALTVSIMIILPSMFLSGMIVSVDIISSSPVMQWISRLMPFRYTTANIVETTVPVEQLHIILSDVRQIEILNGNAGHLISNPAKQVYVFMPDAKAHGVLQDLVLNQQYHLVENSSNDIFGLTKGFSVRRVPSIDQIKEFMKNFLSGTNNGQINTNSARFMTLWGQIQTNNWSWLNLFLEHNNELYTVAEKSLNIFAPLVASAAMGWYVTKHFKWSTR